MKVWGATEAQLREALETVGLKAYGEWTGTTYGGAGITRDGRALRLRLGVDTTQPRTDGYLPYQRHSTWAEHGKRPRKVAAVCWHGHRDFMRAVFALEPDARIKTALADYRGAEDFERKYHDTYGRGNNYNVAYGQACGCPAHVRDNSAALV